MTSSRSTNQWRFRQIHRFLAPIMVLPLLLTVITGVIFQFFDSAGKGDQADWLLQLHTGHFGPLNLSSFYPFLNGLGLLTLLITGFLLWLRVGRTRRRV